MVKNQSANARNIRDAVFDPWVWKIPWKRKWQPSPVFLAWKIHDRSLVGQSPRGQNESDMTEAT